MLFQIQVSLSLTSLTLKIFCCVIMSVFLFQQLNNMGFFFSFLPTEYRGSVLPQTENICKILAFSNLVLQFSIVRIWFY